VPRPAGLLQLLELLLRRVALDEARPGLHGLGVVLDVLTDEQASYIGVTPEGPYKSDFYRY